MPLPRPKSRAGQQAQRPPANAATSPPVAGIAVDPALPAGSVDGTCNWWGDASGPGPVAAGTGALVSPKVTYTSWLIAAFPSGACTGGAATPSPTPIPTANPNAVGGFVDVVTGGSSGSGSSMSWLAVLALAVVAMGTVAGGTLAVVRKRS